MNHLSVDEASRLAVTAVATDLEYWARNFAHRGQIELDDLIDVIDVLRADSIPWHAAATDHTSGANQNPSHEGPHVSAGLHAS